MERLLDFFTPDHYELELKLDKTARLIHGHARIFGAASKSTVKLHAVKLQPSDILIDDAKVDYHYDDKILTIPIKLQGETTIDITFDAPIYPTNEAMTGAYISTYEYEGNTEEIITTQFEPKYASKVFPCIDEPAAKATFKLTIESDADDYVVSNMPCVDADLDAQSGSKRVTFGITPHMSPYLLAFAAGKFKSYSVTSEHGVKVTSYAPLCQPGNLLVQPTETAARALDYYDDLFSTPYPLPKLDQLSLPDFDAGAMENWGLVTYRESMFLCDNNSPIDTLHESAVTIAHELAHMWFGDLVTMYWWDDLWLNEGFATLMAYFAVDQLYPEYSIWNDFYLSYIIAALGRDCLAGVQAVRQPVHDPAEIATLFDGAIVYAKGARLMLMLMREMGEDNFYAGIRKYFKRHAYANAKGNDLWKALQPHADFNVKDFMDAWLDQPGYPVIKGKKQQRFLIDKPTDSSQWPIPRVLDDLSGHYIIDLGKTALANKLQNFAQLSHEQKLRLLFDRQLLARTKAVETASFIDIILPLSNDTSYPVWDATSNLLAALKTFVDHDKAVEADYKHFVHRVTSAQAKRLGLRPRQSEPLDDTQLRPIILCFASYSDNKSIIDAALKIYQKTKIAALDPNIRGNILVIKVKNDETPELIDQLTGLYKTTVDPDLKNDLWHALSSSRHQETLGRLLELILDTTTVRPQDTLSACSSVLHNDFGERQAIDWIYAHWSFLEKTSGDQDLDDYVRLLASVITNRVEEHRFVEFFTPLIEKPALRRAIEVAIPQIAAKIAYIEQDRPEVVKKLHDLANNP